MAVPQPPAYIIEPVHCTYNSREAGAHIVFSGCVSLVKSVFFLYSVQHLKCVCLCVCVMLSRRWVGRWSTCLQRVAGKVSLDRVSEGVGALEHLAARLLAVGPVAGVDVLVEDLPEVVGHVHDLEVLGEPEKKEMRF